ncbi:MAG TPA: hypothetical protein VFH51_14220, partial [Myxococcota bacterium]|nr:hypothetical protein [Myxococcota bacterium]
MSSIDNTNRPAGAPSQTPSYEPDTIEEKHLKKLLESENGGLDIIALLGLTPGAIEGAFKGVPRAATGNKFTAKGAEVNLPPPPVPRFQVKPHSQAAYESMAADIDHVFSQVRGTLPPVNLGWDTKNIPRGTDPKVAAETAAQGLQRLMTHAQTLTSDQMMLAFLVLRVKDQSDGGQIQKEIQDVASKMRQSELDNQIKRDKEANEKMLKAMEKQQKMG